MAVASAPTPLLVKAAVARWPCAQRWFASACVRVVRMAGNFSRGGLSSRPPFGGGAGGPGVGSGGGESVQIAIGGAGSFELDSELESLRGKVSALRGIATAVGEESRITKEHSDALEDALRKAKDAMRNATKRMDKLYREAGGAGLLTQVVLFALAVFLLVYILARIRGAVKWIL